MLYVPMYVHCQDDNRWKHCIKYSESILLWEVRLAIKTQKKVERKKAKRESLLFTTATKEHKPLRQHSKANSANNCESFVMNTIFYPSLMTTSISSSRFKRMASMSDRTIHPSKKYANVFQINGLDFPFPISKK